jgi:esterase/lipase superfamily enzyme
MRNRADLGFSACLLGAILLSACSSGEPLAPTPAAFAEPLNRPSEGVHSIAASGDLDLLYVTDRAPTSDPRTKALSYGSERSRTMSFGSIDIRVEPDSTGATEGMKLDGITEIGRFPEVLYPAVTTSSGYRRSPAVVAAHEEAVASLQDEIHQRLAKSARKEVVIFIHGYNSTFADAAFATGNICRLLGPDFVCVVLTWRPADRAALSWATTSIENPASSPSPTCERRFARSAKPRVCADSMLSPTAGD